MNMTKDDISNRTPESQRFCSEWFSRLRFEGPYTPFGTSPSLLMPGTMGGGNWGGVSFDPQLGYIYVNTSSLGGAGQMVKSAAGAPMPYRNTGGYTRFIDQDQYPCQKPPWGELSAVNANTGDIVWRKTLGGYDELEAQGFKNAGAPNMGGSIVTAGGLVFIAATTDSKFRAFNSRTGEELWMTRLDASGDSVPMTFMGRDGKQYVVIAAGGTNRFRMLANTADKTADGLIAFALSEKHEAASGTQGDRSVSPRSREAATEKQALPDGDGKALVVRICTTCHGAAVFATLGMNRSGWKNEVAAMVDKGATATDDELRRVIDYLAKTFPRH